jgi:hypothetical protein
MQRVIYLGYHLDASGVSSIPSKLEIIQKWSTPTTLKGLRGFLGFVNRYFSSYPHLAIVSAALARATGKRQFEWTSEMEQSFVKTKRALRDVNTPAILAPRRKFVLETDASGVGIGAVLLQEQDGVERPIAFYFKALSDAESRYDTMRLALMALVRAVQNSQIHLARQQFQVRTDSTGVRYWRNIEAPVPSVILKWSAYLSSFNFEIEHLAGRHNSIADALSRFPSSVPNTQLKPARVRSGESVQPQNTLICSESVSKHYTMEIRLVIAAL